MENQEDQRHHSNLPKDDFRVKYFEALNLIIASMRTRFDQPRLIAFSLIKSNQLKGQGIVKKLLSI